MTHTSVPILKMSHTYAQGKHVVKKIWLKNNWLPLVKLGRYKKLYLSHTADLCQYTL